MPDDQFPADEDPTDTSGWSTPTLGSTGIQTHNQDSAVFWHPDGSVSTYTPGGAADTDAEDQAVVSQDVYAPTGTPPVDPGDPYEE
jgi:hypothetical protein